MHRPAHERHEAPALDDTVDAAQAEREAMHLVRVLRERVQRERETVRQIRAHLEGRRT